METRLHDVYLCEGKGKNSMAVGEELVGYIAGELTAVPESIGKMWDRRGKEIFQLEWEGSCARGR